MPQTQAAGSSRMDLVRWAGLVLGPLLALLTFLLLPGENGTETGLALGYAGRVTAAVATWMAVWWLTEALPLSATALLPLALFPTLGVAGITETAAPYASDLIFLFGGGFILGLGMQRWNLHRRIALITILLVGTKPKRLIAGFMLATAVMSMWVSNSATAVMMLPIGVSVIDLVYRRLGGSFDAHDRDHPGANFATCIMLGIAFGASIGGVGTLIGTPPNIVLANFIRSAYGQEITFFRWMLIGIPLVAVFLPIAWYVLTSLVYPVRLDDVPGGTSLIRDEYARLGAMSRGEWTVFLVFSCTAAAWLLRDQLVKLPGLSGLTDPGIAVMAALALFVIPVDAKKRVFAMDWSTAEKLPWGILILFGGGLSLAATMGRTGVDTFIGELFTQVGQLPHLPLIALVASVVVFLTTLTSNTAVTNALLPILAAAAIGLHVHPYLLIIPAAMAASCAFMLPVATPPNAIVFSSGYITLPQMAWAGLWMTAIGIVIITTLVYFFGGALLGIDLSQIPEWAVK